MKKYSCPSCGAEVIFTSNISVYAICKYCTSMIVRHDTDVESIGKMAVLPDDISPFKIGTEGVYGGVNFSLIGRMKMTWQNGSWNEWFFATESGKKGWLAEAQGFYALSFEMEKNEVKKIDKSIKNFFKPAAATGLRSNKKPIQKFLKFNKKAYTITDVKEAVCVGSEGELPLYATINRASTVVDCTGGNGEFACVEFHQESIRVFTGHYIEWNDLKCQNYKEFDWPAKLGSKQ